MVLNYKSSISIQEASVGNSQGKAGLKRKLTGPPRLLLGKSKAKSDLEDISRRHIGGNNNNGTNRGTMETHQATIREERSSECTSENPRKPVESEEEGAIPESEAKIEQKKQSMNRGWKRFFSPSLICIRRRRKRLGKLAAVDSFTFCNTRSAEFDCDTELATGHIVTLRERQDAHTSKHQRDTSVKGARWDITKLLNASSHHKKAKGLSEQKIHFGYEDSLRPHLSLKKKVERFLKHGTKKPSPFFHEQLGRDPEYIEEETIVLSNIHADDAVQKSLHDIQEGDNSEVGGPHSETLTVSVEVSIMGEGEREERDFTETSTDLEAYASLSNANDPGAKDGHPQGLADAGLEAYDRKVRMADFSEPNGDPMELVMMDLFMEDGGWKMETPREILAVQGASASSLSPVHAREAHEDLLEGQDLRCPVDDSSPCIISEKAGAHEANVVEEYTPQNTVTDEDSMQYNLALKNVKFDSLSLCHREIKSAAENGPEMSSEESVHPGDNGYQQGLFVKDIGSQCSDVLLVQTACSLVQAAMKAALDQLTEELKDKSTSIHTEHHKSQDHT